MGPPAAIIVFNSIFFFAAPADNAPAADGILVTMPRNPERPMREKTCNAARERLQEAEQGSPLVSPSENQRILDGIRAEAERLCDHHQKPE